MTTRIPSITRGLKFDGVACRGIHRYADIRRSARVAAVETVVKSNRAWRLECEALRAQLAEAKTLILRQHDALAEYIGPDWDIDASPQTLADVRQAEQQALVDAQAQVSALREFRREIEIAAFSDETGTPEDAESVWAWLRELCRALAAQPQELEACDTEDDCEYQPWCKIRGKCQKLNRE